MFRTLFGRPTRQSPIHHMDAALRFRPTLVALEARDVPAVIYDNTFALTGSGGNATVQVTVDAPSPAATPTYIWTYKVTNVNIGTDDPDDYRQSDSQTSFWTFADARLDFAQAEFAFGSGPSGWTNGLFASADADDTTIYFGLYAGVNVDHPNLGHDESATFSFSTAPRLLVTQSATFGDDTFGEATGDIIGPGELLTTGILVTPLGDAAENGPGSGFVISRAGGDLSQPLTVALGVGGTAAETTDYTALPASVTFEPYQSDIILTITPAADNVVEGDETVSVTVSAAAGYNPVGTGTAAVTIADDAPTVEIADGAREVYEGSPIGVVFERTGGKIAEALTIQVVIGPAVGDDPVTPADFTVSGATSLGSGVYAVTFAAGATTATVTVNPIADGIDEETEWFSVAVADNPGYISADIKKVEVAVVEVAPPPQTRKQVLLAQEKRLTREIFDLTLEVINLGGRAAGIKEAVDLASIAVNDATTEKLETFRGYVKATDKLQALRDAGVSPLEEQYKKAQEDVRSRYARFTYWEGRVEGLTAVERKIVAKYRDIQDSIASKGADLDQKRIELIVVQRELATLP